MNDWEEKKRAKGMKELQTPCSICGRARTRHTIAEANECKKQEASTGPKKMSTKVKHVSSEYMQNTFRAYNDVKKGWKK